MEKNITIAVCDLCKSDRPAVATRTIDVCRSHDAKLDERQGEAHRYICKCGKGFTTLQGLRHHQGSYNRPGRRKAEHNSYADLEEEAS